MGLGLCVCVYVCTHAHLCIKVEDVELKDRVPLSEKQASLNRKCEDVQSHSENE